MRRNELPDLVISSQDPQQFIIGIADWLQDAIDIPPSASPDIKLLRKWMFINQGWRLTWRGYSLLHKHYKSYTSHNPANEIMVGKVLLLMDPCVQGPWWTSGEKVAVFDQMVHFELEMVDGNARTYVDFRNNRK